MTSYVLVPFQACFRLIRRAAALLAELIPPPFAEPAVLPLDPRVEALMRDLREQQARMIVNDARGNVYPFPVQACSPYRLEQGGTSYCTATGKACSCSTLKQSD